MTIARDIAGTVFKGGSATLLARVVGSNDVALVRADVSSVSYTIEELDTLDKDVATVVSGHDGVALVVNTVFYNSLQTDSRWTADSTGYNFAHELVVSSSDAFIVAGRNYRVTVRIVPVSGQVIIVRFKLQAV